MTSSTTAKISPWRVGRMNTRRCTSTIDAGLGAAQLEEPVVEAVLERRVHQPVIGERVIGER